MPSWKSQHICNFDLTKIPHDHIYFIVLEHFPTKMLIKWLFAGAAVSRGGAEQSAAAPAHLRAAPAGEGAGAEGTRVWPSAARVADDDVCAGAGGRGGCSRACAAPVYPYAVQAQGQIQAVATEAAEEGARPVHQLPFGCVFQATAVARPPLPATASAAGGRRPALPAARPLLVPAPLPHPAPTTREAVTLWLLQVITTCPLHSTPLPTTPTATPLYTPAHCCCCPTPLELLLLELCFSLSQTHLFLLLVASPGDGCVVGWLANNDWFSHVGVIHPPVVVVCPSPLIKYAVTCFFFIAMLGFGGGFCWSTIKKGVWLS